MHILITDSGVGGLSVVAYAERHVRLHGTSEPVRLTFANAAPENDYGYNSMPSREEKIATFDRFLRNVTARFAPDAIYVACNTLSVLLPDTPYFAARRIPVQGIVETGVSLLMRELESEENSTAILFGTQTTIDAGTYPRLLVERSIAPARIVSQACPGLADTISEDREGKRAAAEIRRWVDEAIRRMQRPGDSVVAYMACTHYGYRRELFGAALEAAGVRARIIDPNERAAGDLIGASGERGPHRTAAVEFVTRYPIPDTTRATLTFLLEDISPATVAAMQNFVHLADLF